MNRSIAALTTLALLVALLGDAARASAAQPAPSPSPTASAVSQGAAALRAIFAKPAIDPALFAPNFVSKIPVSDVQTFVSSYVDRLGAPIEIDDSGHEFALVSPKGTIKVNVAFDDRGRISSLLFHDELSAANLAALQRVLAADTVSSDWFEPSYLKDIPTTKLASVLTDMHKTLGKFVRVDTRGGTYVAVFDKGESHAQISADADGRIDYLAFSKP